MKRITILKNGQKLGSYQDEDDSKVEEWLRHHEDIGYFGDPSEYEVRRDDPTAEVEAQKTKAVRRQQAVQFIKNLNIDDLDGATTIAGVKTKLKVIFKALKESYDD